MEISPQNSPNFTDRQTVTHTRLFNKPLTAVNDANMSENCTMNFNKPLIISSVKINGKIYHEFAILREDLDTLIPHPSPLFWRHGPA